MKKEIELNLGVYSMDNIYKGIIDFSQVCSIYAEKNGNKMVCNFDCNDRDYIEIKDEFCNYVLALCNRGKIKNG
ncbi:HxsD-like protein [Sporanaerobacter sp. PP17-6a]|uniref:HxsD-like protein n=1 Tax=Sporanaerobacter sp. PP17-6a TaxID=1891289 RepID=UPI00089F8ED3|nr:HxsD-like protein [Sporanaerobacter sp. PP17-6a]SCL81220.1 hypothetical protein PP176A_0004 [Sporanaerobacter sp. PP17-6a]